MAKWRPPTPTVAPACKAAGQRKRSRSSNVERTRPTGSRKMSVTFSHLVVHLVAAGSFAYGLYYDFNHVVVPEPLRDRIHITAFGGRWKYLTVWNMVVQLVFHWLSLMNDMIGSDTQERKKVTALQKIRDTLFAVLAFPLGLFISTSFWGLWIVDRNLVFPEILDTFIPFWLNQVMHSICMPLILLELFLSYHHYPQRYKGFLAVGLFICIYISWTLVVAHVGGIWVYPILEMLNWWQLILFEAGGAGVLMGFYMIGEKSNQLVWVKKKQTKGNNKQPKVDGKKKKRKTN